MVSKVLILSALLLAGCQSTGGQFCQVTKPLRLSEQAIAGMNDQEVAQALAHNKKGQKLCGWTP